MGIDFEAEMKHIYNPSQVSTISPLLNSFWKWSALILAVLTFLASMIAKFQQSMRQTRLKSLASCKKSCCQQVYDDDDLDFEISDQDDTPLLAAESDDEEDYRKPAGEVFRSEGPDWFEGSYKGQYGIVNKFFWSEFPAGKNLVQVWDDLGLGLDPNYPESDYGGDDAIWDLDSGVDISSSWCSKDPTVAENNVVTAEMNDGDVGVSLGGYDAGMPGKIWTVYEAGRRGGYHGNARLHQRFGCNIVWKRG